MLGVSALPSMLRLAISVLLQTDAALVARLTRWIMSQQVPFFHAGKNIMRTNFSSHSAPKSKVTVIENDVWIGMGCYVKAGVTIHTGAVVGMGSVVTHDIPPYEIWAGNPARFIRKRFDENTIEKLLNSEWWDWSDSKIAETAVMFDDTEKFIQYLEREYNNENFNADNRISAAGF